MKMKFIFTIFTLLGMFFLVSCKNETGTIDEKNKHSHTYSDEWKYDEEMHWHECSCGYEADRSKHIFVNGSCSVCGYLESKLTYMLLDNDTYEVYLNKNNINSNIIIPDTYRGKPVTSIGDSAFSTCEDLENITLPSTIKKIGRHAFYGCENLKSIIIPSSVTSIGEGAFHGCISLENVDLPEGISTIEDKVFSECLNLTSITLPNSLRIIKEYAFMSCYKLVEIFNLSDLDIAKESDDFGNIGKYAKVIHNKLEDSNLIKKDCYTFINIDNEYSLVSYNGTETKIVLPSDINGFSYRISDYAFYNNDKIISITLPNSLIGIGEFAFYYCYKLVEIFNLSDLDIAKESDDFGNIGKYAKVIHNELEDSNLFNDGDYTFINNNNEYFLVSYNGIEAEITLPNKINGSSYKISDYAFYDCQDLIGVIIPEGITGIENGAFYNCIRITNIIIPSTVTSIDSEAFFGCNRLKEIIIPEGVIAIEDYAFECCSALTSVVIPSTLTSIGYKAFSSCRSIINVYYKGTVDNWSNIKIELLNTCLTGSTIFYYSEEEPLDTANKYWHYVDNKIVIWE